MKEIVNVHAYLKVLETIWKRRGWTLVPEDHFMPRTDGKGVVYYQRSMFDPTYIAENPEQWPLAVYALKHEANHNLPGQAPIFKYMREKEINMLSFYGGVGNLLWDELNDRTGYRGSIDLQGRVTFCETKWDFTKVPKTRESCIIRTIFAWDCMNRCSWNDLLVPFTHKVIALPEEQERWLEALIKGKYYDRLFRLSIEDEEQRGFALWKLTRDILEEVFDYEVPDVKENPPETPTQPEDGEDEKTGEGSASKETADGQDCDENVASESTSEAGEEGSESVEKQQDTVVDYEDLLVSPHVCDADVTKMDDNSVAKIRIDYSNYKGRRYYKHYAHDEFTVIDFDTNEVQYAKRTR